MTQPANSAAVEHFMRIAWEPIAVPRWALTVKYALFLACGISAFASTVKTLSASTPSGYEAIWAGFIAIGALIGAFGSLRPRWGWIEAIGASTLVAFLIVLTFLMFDRGAIPVAILLLIVNVLPAVRTCFLVARIALSLVYKEGWKL